ncbi:helix-turn-helix domain-containing protein [Mumia sp. ZJ1417]|uniref:helix-turn-helix domain-containing protein n=1 Tax=Mumia sp. ZJ1417 TaxID=2708082 RepID=UPI0014218452|nr:helix-turn-helix domain-containing protein [Mumia sp. ZJ1417]QMW64983.1 helix-turn-helix domain-containing protein [Mumia sp. ZJ1417]
MTDRLEQGRTPDPAGTGAGEVLEVRRSAGVLALVAVGAGVLAIAYAVRAAEGSMLLWLVAGLLAGGGLLAGRGWFDARSPLLVADSLGVRVRHGDAWRGFPWADVDHIVLAEPRGLLADGAIDVVASDGTAFVVPLGLAVRASSEDVAAALRQLSGDDEIVVEPDPDPQDGPDPAAPVPPVPDSIPPVPDPAPPVPDSVDSPPNDEPDPVENRPNRGREGGPDLVEPTVSAPARIDLGLVQSVGSSALAPGYKVVTALRASRGRPELVIDAPAARVAPPLVVDEPAPESEPEDAESETVQTVPGLGDLLRTARESAGVSIDGLAERTRIRPHVIEALEADDVSACGGDFYARGHLRSLARALGADPAPWIARYDASYAQAPIPARAVFEAERATGSQTIRVARGGRSWLAVTVVVLVLAIIWGIGQLVVGNGDDADAPAAVPTEVAPPPTDPSSLAGLGAPTTNHLLIRGKEKKPTKITVTDGTGATIWTGDIAKGEFKRVSVVGPAKVSVGRADAATVAVNGGKARRVADGSEKASTTVGDS